MTVHVVSVMYVQKEMGKQFCTCIKYVVFVFKNMSKYGSQLYLMQHLCGMVVIF